MVIIAVAHDEFRALGEQDRAFGKSFGASLDVKYCYDIKYVSAGRRCVDGRSIKIS